MKNEQTNGLLENKATLQSRPARKRIWKTAAKTHKGSFIYGASATVKDEDGQNFKESGTNFFIRGNFGEKNKALKMQLFNN